MGMNRDMMARMQKMQQQMLEAQEAINKQTLEGTAGGGAVTITITGGLQVQAVKLAPEVVDPEDIEMLEDLVTAAVNEAVQKAQALQAEQLGGLAGQLGIGMPQ